MLGITETGKVVKSASWTDEKGSEMVVRTVSREPNNVESGSLKIVGLADKIESPR